MQFSKCPDAGIPQLGVPDGSDDANLPVIGNGIVRAGGRQAGQRQGRVRGGHRDPHVAERSGTRTAYSRSGDYGLVPTAGYPVGVRVAVQVTVRPSPFGHPLRPLPGDLHRSDLRSIRPQTSSTTAPAPPSKVYVEVGRDEHWSHPGRPERTWCGPISTRPRRGSAHHQSNGVTRSLPTDGQEQDRVQGQQRDCAVQRSGPFHRGPGRVRR